MQLCWTLAVRTNTFPKSENQIELHGLRVQSHTASLAVETDNRLFYGDSGWLSRYGSATRHLTAYRTYSYYTYITSRWNRNRNIYICMKLDWLWRTQPPRHVRGNGLHCHKYWGPPSRAHNSDYPFGTRINSVGLSGSHEAPNLDTHSRPLHARAGPARRGSSGWKCRWFVPKWISTPLRTKTWNRCAFTVFHNNK